MKTLKNGPQKLLIIGPNLFFSQSSPQPMIDFSYYKYVPRPICLLIFAVRLWLFFSFGTFDSFLAWSWQKSSVQPINQSKPVLVKGDNRRFRAYCPKKIYTVPKSLDSVMDFLECWNFLVFESGARNFVFLLKISPWNRKWWRQKNCKNHFHDKKIPIKIGKIC